MNDDKHEVIDYESQQRSPNHQIIDHTDIVSVIEVLQDGLSDIAALPQMLDDELACIAGDHPVEDRHYRDQSEACLQPQ